MSESLEGFSVAATRHTAGRSANGLACGAGPPPRAGGADICPAATGVALVMVTPGSFVAVSLPQAAASSAGPNWARTPGENHAIENAVTSAAHARRQSRNMRRIVGGFAPVSRWSLVVTELTSIRMLLRSNSMKPGQTECPRVVNIRRGRAVSAEAW